MNMTEIESALRQLRLGGIAHVLSTRLLEARTDKLDYIDFLSNLVSDELHRRGVLDRGATGRWACSRSLARARA